MTKYGPTCYRTYGSLNPPRDINTAPYIYIWRYKNNVANNYVIIITANNLMLSIYYYIEPTNNHILNQFPNEVQEASTMVEQTRVASTFG